MNEEKPKIINFIIPMDKEGNLIIEYKMINTFISTIKNSLGESYTVCTTPFKAEYNENVELENVDLDILSIKEFLEKHKINID